MEGMLEGKGAGTKTKHRLWNLSELLCPVRVQSRPAWSW